MKTVTGICKLVSECFRGRFLVIQMLVTTLQDTLAYIFFYKELFLKILK
jgi:hypothetical protein